MIKLFIELGYSNSKLKQLFKVGGYRLLIKKEFKDNMLLPDYIEESWTEQSKINQHTTVYRKRKLRTHFLSMLIQELRRK